MIRIFLGLTLLLKMSIDFREVFLAGGRLPFAWLQWLGVADLALAAVIVATFLVIARIPYRIPDTRPGQTLLTIGLVSYVVVQLLAGSLLGEMLGRDGSGRIVADARFLVVFLAVFGGLRSLLLAVVQAILLVGAYRLLTSLTSPTGSAVTLRRIGADAVNRVTQGSVGAVRSRHTRNAFERLLALVVVVLVAGLIYVYAVNKIHY